MFKKLAAAFLSACLIFSFAACNGANGGEKKVIVTMKDGAPSAPGDVFKLPDIKSSGAGAPVVATVSKQAGPDTTITVAGEGFTGAKAYIYAQTDKSNGKEYEAKTTVTDDTNMAVTIDSSVKYGMYGVYVKSANGTSDIKLINKPAVWWIGLTTVTADEELSIYGENLTNGNADGADKTHIYLVSEKKYCEAEVTYADPYKVTIKIPSCLTENEKYTIRVHNGHGGDLGFADSDEQITYVKSAPVQFGGEKIDVTDFGAIPNKKNNDDTAFIQAAIDSANDGDIIYFPRGTYLCKSALNVDKALKFEGAGTDKSIVVASVKLDGYVFEVTASPIEFTGLAFEAIRDSKIKSGFINVRGANNNGAKSVYIHGCKFTSSASLKSCSMVFPIQILDSKCAVIENNELETTGLICTRNSSKVFLRNNNYKGMLYSTNYYNQNSIFMVDSDEFDVSNNKMYGKDIDDDPSGRIDDGDLTIGRAFAIQGHCYDFYAGNNDIQRAGLPNDNAGEQIMLENTSRLYNGPIKSSTETDVTMPDDFTKQASKGCIITIIDGKGKGQYRTVSTFKKKVITVNEPWDIVPDSTSRVFLTKCFDNIAIHNNKMDCYSNYAEDPGATTGVQAYGNITNMFITGNEFKNMSYGLCISPRYNAGKDSDQNFVNWSIVQNNKIERCCIGIRYNMVVTNPLTGKIPGNLSIGVLIRNNSVSNIRDYTNDSWTGKGGVGFAIGEISREDGSKDGSFPTWEGAWIYAPVIEKNTFKECETTDIALYKHEADVVLRGNKGADGDAKYKVGHLGKEPVIIK